MTMLTEDGQPEDGSGCNGCHDLSTQLAAAHRLIEVLQREAASWQVNCTGHRGSQVPCGMATPGPNPTQYSPASGGADGG
jgi:hypothetical protein